MDEEALKTAVETALRETPRVDAREVEVRVADGTVTLTGIVDSALEKRHARHTAEEVAGVRSVIDHLQVRGFIHRPDAELAEEIRHRLSRDAFAPADIEVYVSGGEVRLDGWTRTYGERRAAEQVAWWTPGVRNVENLLLVTDEPFVDVSPGEVVDTG